MANALTPCHPARQLAALPFPTLLLVAENDELFITQAMAAFADQHGNAQLRFSIIQNSSHLDCLFYARQQICQHLMAMA